MKSTYMCILSCNHGFLWTPPYGQLSFGPIICIKCYSETPLERTFKGLKYLCYIAGCPLGGGINVYLLLKFLFFIAGCPVKGVFVYLNGFHCIIQPFYKGHLGIKYRNLCPIVVHNGDLVFCTKQTIYY